MPTSTAKTSCVCVAFVYAPQSSGGWGDFLALLGAARIGERLVLELGREVGWETLEKYTEQWFDYSEKVMVAAIREIPSTEIIATTTHDPFPGVPNGVRIKIGIKKASAWARSATSCRPRWR